MTELAHHLKLHVFYIIIFYINFEMSGIYCNNSNVDKSNDDCRIPDFNAQTYRRSSLESCYKREEKKKKRAYEQRILDVEHGTFTPLVFSTSGGMGRLARTFYARLAHLLSIKRQTRYAATMGLIRCKISFSLMRAAIMCLRGARSSANHASRACDSIHLAVTEGHLTY